jgi:hypothetical protein
MERSVVMTRSMMKAELAAIVVTQVANGGAALRVEKYLRGDTLLLLEIHGAPVVSSSTHLTIADARSEPIRAAIAMPYFVSDQALQKELLQRWMQLNCQRVKMNFKEGWILRDTSALRDSRHQNEQVQDYCSELSTLNQLKAACLQFNLDRLECDDEGSKLSEGDSIPLALAERLELVPLGSTEEMPSSMRLTFAYLDDDKDGARLRTLSEKWNKALSTAREGGRPAAKKQKTGSSAAAPASAGSRARKRKRATSGSSAQQSTQQEPEEGVSPRRGAKAAKTTQS